MMLQRSLAAGALMMLILPGCGSHSQPPSAAATAPPPAPSAPPAPPPPSPEQLFADALSTIGTTNTYRGPVAVFQTPKPAKGKWAMSPDDAARLDKIADVLKQNPETDLIIDGYTDNVGARKVNTRLSLEHAKAFQNALVQDRGIGAERIRVHGLGEENPAADNGSADGRAKNQRVEIVFSSRQGEFAYAADQPSAETGNDHGKG